MKDRAFGTRATVLLHCLYGAAAASLALSPMRAGASEAANVYMAGAEVKIATAVEGDLYAAAGRLSVEQPVRGDAVLAAGSIDVTGAIGDDLRAAGGIVSVGGRIAGEAVIAAGNIAFGPDTEVQERAWLAGGDIAVAGRFRGGLKVYGRNIVLLGEIHGPVQLHGEQIEILGSARVLGDVTYSSDRPIRIHREARISGSVHQTSGAFRFKPPRLQLPGLPIARPLLLLGLLAAGALLFTLFPRFTAHAVQTLGASPVKSLGLGTAIFFSLPPVILLLAITIIGIPIALVLAAFYGAALLIGYLVTALFVGERIARTVRAGRAPSFGWRIAALALALVLLWLAYTLPYIGGLILLLALLAGIGAMVLQAFNRYAEAR